jgi:UDP-GlcNAc:undecaprenyl-phosphate GlcNAc-1-phosphate transferase
MLWIAGVVNAMNLIDGLDGLAGGVALSAVATTFVVAVLHAHPLMVLFTAALGGAILGFLLYNLRPASIFMGDTGSMFLGFVLAATSIQTSQKSSTAVAILIPVLALGVPIGDTLLAMARRAARGAPLFSADRGHIHHRLLDLGLSHRQTVLVLYGASGALGATALLIAFATSAQAAVILLAVCGIAYLALRRLGYADLGKVRRLLQERRRNLLMREAVRRAGQALRVARSGEDVWAAVRVAAPEMGAVAVALRLAGETWEAGFDEVGPDLLRVRCSLSPDRRGRDEIELGWNDGRKCVDRDVEIVLEILCDHVGTALDRMDGEEAARLRDVARAS